MNYEIETRAYEAQPTVTMTRRVHGIDKMQKTLAEILPASFGYAIEKGEQPAGPPFTRYLEHDHEKGELLIQAGVPVATKVEGEGDIEASELPAGEVAFTWHVGPYDQLGNAFEAVEAWMKANGKEAAGPPWEVYWTDPGQEPDPGKWRTEIVWPVR